MNSYTTSAGSAELDAVYILLKRLSENSASPPTAEECKQIAAQISDVEQGAYITEIARILAKNMCQQVNATNRIAGILLLKELSKRGDPYAMLTHAWLRWNDGPLKNHQQALALINEVLQHAWPEWPMYERARIALGEAFRLKGLLLFRGDKVKRNPSEALWHFKWAADKYLDGHAAWLAAQFHAKNPKSDFANKAKPHAAAYTWYMERAKEQGYVPEEVGPGEQEQA